MSNTNDSPKDDEIIILNIIETNGAKSQPSLVQENIIMIQQLL